MKRGTCATCVYYVDWKNECRYNPPQVIKYENPNGYKSVWPIVDSDDFCHGWVDGHRGGTKIEFPQLVESILTKEENK